MRSQRVYFGKLSRDCRERDLEKLCREFGRCRDVRLLQGFGFAEFDDVRDAEDCVKDMDGTRFLGERIIVEFAKGRRDHDRRDRDRSPRREPVKKCENRIQVLGLPDRVSWQDLKDLMRKAGEVQYTNVDRNGDGVVEFITLEGKEKAMELFDGYDYNGSRLTIKHDQTASSKPRSRSPRGRSRSRSRNRSSARKHSRSRSPRSKSRSPKESRQSRSRSRGRKSASPDKKMQED